MPHYLSDPWHQRESRIGGFIFFCILAVPALIAAAVMLIVQ